MIAPSDAAAINVSIEQSYRSRKIASIVT